MVSDRNMVQQSPTTLTVLGGGAWGTAIAAWLARNGHTVRQWARSSTVVNEINSSQTNHRYLPNISLPNQITAYSSLDEAMRSSSGVVLVVPSLAFDSVMREVAKNLDAMSQLHKPFVVWGTKGLEPGTGRLLSDLAENILGDSAHSAVLSGPSFALEISAGLPAALVIGSKVSEDVESVADWFRNDVVRIYTNRDVVGIQLGGAVKNVIAIAAGVSDGLNLGVNARSALITRGLAEMRRLNLALGGQDETLMGLAGMGDLILTCSDNKSRNRRTGLGLGLGKPLNQILMEIGQEAEGVHAAKEVHKLSEKLNVEMPITRQVFRMLFKSLPASDAVKELLARDPAQE